MSDAVLGQNTSALLFQSATSKGLSPSWLTSSQRMFAIQTEQGEQYVSGLRSLNTFASAKLARNKYLTRIVLERNELPNIPYTYARTPEEAQQFLSQHQKIIVKPLRGAGSVNIQIVDSPEQLDGIDLAESIFEKYIVGKEMRYLVLNGNVLGVHESKYGTSVDPKRTLERISYHHTEWDETHANMAVDISKILGLTIAAVDYLVDKDGRHYVLEVNSAPGLKWFHAPSEGPSLDLAGALLDAMIASDN